MADRAEYDGVAQLEFKIELGFAALFLVGAVVLIANGMMIGGVFGLLGGVVTAFRACTIKYHQWTK